MKRCNAWTGVFVPLGAIAGGILVKKLWKEKYRQLREKMDQAEQERDLLHAWLLLRQRKVELTEYFDVCGYKSVAIFGMGWMGRRLCDELGERAVYGVEQDNLGAVHERLTVYRLGDDPLPPADCMVICDVERLPEKEAAAHQGFSGEIIPLRKVLEWLLNRG